jgi:hypothetical protein
LTVIGTVLPFDSALRTRDEGLTTSLTVAPALARAAALPATVVFGRHRPLTLSRPRGHPLLTAARALREIVAVGAVTTTVALPS